MTKIIGLFAMFAFSVGFFGEGALANRADRRQENQQKRIDKGIQNKELTPGETRKLEHQQNRIDHAEDRMKADGTVTPEEKHRLEKMQDRASRRIHRMKHNKRDGQSPADPAPAPETPVAE